MSSVDHGHESEPADAPAEQITLDGSVGSDTDTGGHLRSESVSKDASDGQHHARSNSVKKPITFKAVSVTKNFLAKAGTPTPPPTKVNGENALANAGSAMPPPPKPRLVAKTASGTKGSGPKTSNFGSKGGGSSGPDPMQVWNRNRAAPQPTPKHFTDEELKQQYGIHLATRLQADGDGKEAKWADIDDDEDDWAPETIEWNDGTKIDLTQNDSAAAAAEEEAAAAAAKARQEEERKAKQAGQQKPTTTVGPNATVLKPRSAAQPKSGGLVLKTPSEKPTLVSKPSAPAPVRSPWAPLPPVDKVAPVEINPPVQTPGSRPQANGAFGANSVPPSAPPAVEIAADDFTRTRRDPQNGNSGQLFNAVSGQYEPAQTGRRGSVRKDQGARPPSVLQRGSAADPQRPAEPSAAFQTHRSNQQENSNWQRRSSNVSGDSGLYGRRTSISKSSDARQDRRGSQQSQVVQSPTTSSVGHAQTQSTLQSPAVQYSQLSQDVRSAAGSPYQNRAGAPDQNAAAMRDDVAAQKQLMKEKRELAIKRRKEEEEREEAAKKERIRKKMEALGMEPLVEKKEPEQKDVQSKMIERRPAENSQIEKDSSENKKIGNNETSQTATSAHEPAAAATKSPPKPPAPSATGAPQQYGMMKVHGTSPKSLAQPGIDRFNPERSKTQPSSQKVSPPSLEPEAETETGDHIIPPLLNGVAPPKAAESLIQKSPEMPTQTPLREARPQPWNNIPRDPSSYLGWTGQNATRDTNSVSNSVWGAPAQSRALGNGTFDRTIQRPQSRQQDQYQSPALAPIGPPKHLQHAKDLRDPIKLHEASHFSTAEDSQTIPSFPPSEMLPGRSDAIGRDAGGNQMVSPPQPGPSTQPRPRDNEYMRPPQDVEQRKAGLAAWGTFTATVAQDEAEKSRQHALQNEARLAEEARTGIRYEPRLPIMHETWRQVKVDPQGMGRSIIGVSRAQNAHGLGPAPHMMADVQGPPFPGPMSVAPAPPMAGIGRGSRFFPTAGRTFPPYEAPKPFTPGYRRSSSPPPPDSEGHPAFVQDQQFPIVLLPPVNPKPKVRLPPAVATPVQSPKLVVAEVQPIHLSPASQPLVNTPSWQNRFNDLLGVKKLSPEKRVALVAGFSATKEPLDLPLVQVAASVSLPPKSEQQSGLAEVLIASKNHEDQEALFDEPESGSLPVILLPRPAPGGAWSTSKPVKRGLPKHLKPSKEVEPLSREALVPGDFVTDDGVLIFIKVSGMSVPKSKTMFRLNGQVVSQGPQGAQGMQRQRHFSAASKPAKTVKPRDNSGSYSHNPKTAQINPSKNIQHGPPKTTQHRGPRSQSRPQTDQASSGW